MDPDRSDARDEELDRLRRAAFSRDGTEADLDALRDAERAAARRAAVERPVSEHPASEPLTDLPTTPPPPPPSRARRAVPVVVGAVLALIVVALLWPRGTAGPDGASGPEPSDGPSSTPTPTVSHVPVDPSDERSFISAIPVGSVPVDPDDAAVQARVAATMGPNGIDDPFYIGVIDGWTYYSGRNGDVSVCFFRFVSEVDEGRCVTPTEFDSVGVVIPGDFLDVDHLDSANRVIEGSITLRSDQTIAFDLVPPSELAAG